MELLGFKQDYKQNELKIISLNDIDKNKIYKSGTIIYDKDIQSLKIADGIHRYNELPYCCSTNTITSHYIPFYYGEYFYKHSIHIKESKIDNTIYEDGTIVAIIPDEEFDKEKDLHKVTFKLANGKDKIIDCPWLLDTTYRKIVY